MMLKSNKVLLTIMIFFLTLMVIGTISGVSVLADEVSEEDIPSLAEVYSDYFPIGAAVNSRTIHSERELIVKHFNSLTAENEMKPDALQPNKGLFTYNKGDEIVDLAMENDMMVRGHALVWHSQTPDWFFSRFMVPLDREQVIENMENHINEVMGRYKGKVYAWDVVNEAISDNNSEFYRTESKWLEVIGEDYIKMAFEFAHTADPNAKLFYNDYNAIQPGKRERIFEMLEGLVKDGVPIHGVGLQAHWNIHWPSISDIRKAIEMYSSLGLEIQITELDLSVYQWGDNRKLTEPTESMINKQKERYKEIFELFREYSDVITGVTFWGVADNYTWLDNHPVQGRKNWPFLFDEKGEPKESFREVVDF